MSEQVAKCRGNVLPLNEQTVVACLSYIFHVSVYSIHQLYNLQQIITCFDTNMSSSLQTCQNTHLPSAVRLHYMDVITTHSKC